MPEIVVEVERNPPKDIMLLQLNNLWLEKSNREVSDSLFVR